MFHVVKTSTCSSALLVVSVELRGKVRETCLILRVDSFGYTGRVCATYKTDRGLLLPLVISTLVKGDVEKQAGRHKVLAGKHWKNR